MNTAGVLWGTGIRRKLTTSLGLAIAVATSITTVPPAWSALGLPEIASKNFVQKFAQDLINPLMHAESKLEIAQAQTTQTLNQIYLSQLQSSLYSAQADMVKAPTQTVQERIDTLQQQIKDLQTKAGGSR